MARPHHYLDDDSGEEFTPFWKAPDEKTSREERSLWAAYQTGSIEDDLGEVDEELPETQREQFTREQKEAYQAHHVARDEFYSMNPKGTHEELRAYYQSRYKDGSLKPIPQDPDDY